VCRRFVKSLLDGYNGTVFAYGATGSGKTYTMVGDLSSPLTAGIMPRYLAALFSEIQQQKKEASVSISYMEVYNEKVRGAPTAWALRGRGRARPSETETFAGCSESLPGELAPAVETVRRAQAYDLLDKTSGTMFADGLADLTRVQIVRTSSGQPKMVRCRSTACQPAA
jgi:hypothetical protein